MEMKKYSCLAAIVMLMMIVTPAYSAAIDDWELPDAPKTDAQLYYDQIPIEKREAFIRHFLAKGLEEQGQVFRVARIGAKEAELEYGVPPADFSKSLLDWTKDEFELDDEAVKRIAVGESFCYGGKICYPGDIGGTCCPF